MMKPVRIKKPLGLTLNGFESRGEVTVFTGTKPPKPVRIKKPLGLTGPHPKRV